MKKFIIILILASSLLLGSCAKDYMDTKSSTAVSNIVALGTVGNAKMALDGVYQQFGYWYPGGSSQFNGYSYFNIYSDIAANVMSQPSSSWWHPEWSFSNHRTGNNTSSGVLLPWEYMYKIIMMTNDIIIGVQKLVPSESEKPLHSSLLGQAFTLRALLYYTLNLHYSPRYDGATATVTLSVPMRNDRTTNSLPRSTQKGIADFILSDIELAITAFATAEENTAAMYLNVEAAKLLKMRMLMYMGQPENVLPIAADLLATTTRNIMGPTEYRKGFVDYTNPEWIFGSVVNRDSNITWRTILWFSSYSWPGSSNHSKVPRTLNMAHMNGMQQSDVDPSEEQYEGAIPNTMGLVMRESDSRRDIFITDSKKEIEENRDKERGYYKNKGFFQVIPENVFSGTCMKYSQTFPGTGSGVGDAVLMRLAEVYYIAAEAASLTGNDALAREYLYATVTPYDKGFVTAESGPRLRTLIANYKAVDMFGEGRCLEDVKRRGEWMYRLAKYNPMRTPVSGQFKSTSPYHAIMMPVIKDFMTMPIPQQAFNNNPLL